MRVHPTGLEVVDRLTSALVVGVIALAATRAKRWTWIVLTGVAATFAATTLAAVLGVIGIVVASLASWSRRPMPVAGAVAGSLGGLATLRMADGGWTGMSLVLGAAAAGPVLVSGYDAAPRSTRHAVRRIGKVAAVVGIVVLVGFGVAVLAARGPASRGADQLEEALDLARSGDLDGAADRFEDAVDALDAADRQLHMPWALPARVIPGLGQNARAVSGALDLARDLTDEAAEVVDVVGSDELSVSDGSIDLSAFDRLDAPVGGLLSAVGTAEGAAAELESPWLVAPVANRLDEITEELRDARETADLAVDAVDALPILLGAGGEQRYLVLFVTPVEARATGFPGNFAELVVRDGHLEMERFGRIADLQFPEQDVTLDLPQAFLDRYTRLGIGVQWRSVTVSPDFPSVAALAAQLYPQTGGRPVDGVMTVDPAGLAALLRFTGPITVPDLDEPLTRRNAEDFLLRRQYVELPDVPDRVDALESLGRTTFDRLTTGDLPPPQQIGQVLGPLADAGHFRFVSFDETAGAFLGRLGLDHPLPEPRADAFAVTSTNAIGGKLDLFLHRTIDYDATWDPATGAIDATVRITLRNDAPSSGLPDYVIGNAFTGELAASTPRGTNRMLVSVFSPLLADEITLDGEPATVANTIEQGNQVYETEVQLEPEGGTAVLELHLAGSIEPGEVYTLDLWNQVLAEPDVFNFSLEVLGSGEPAPIGLDVHGNRVVGELVLDAPKRVEVRPHET